MQLTRIAEPVRGTGWPGHRSIPAAALVTGLLLMPSCGGREQAPPAAAPRPEAVPPPAAAPPAAVELQPEQPIVEELAGDESRSFRLSLDAGELAVIAVYQYGVDVVAELFGPAGDSLIQVDKLTGVSRPERILWVAKEAGPHRLQIRAWEGAAEGGLFEVVLEERRPAAQVDHRRARAEVLFARGVEASASRDAGKTSQAIEDFLAAVAVWEETGDASRRADAWYRLGLLYEARDSRRAMAAFERVLAIPVEAPRPQQEGDALHRLGHLHHELADLEKARDCYLRALPARQEAGFARGVAQTRTNLGLTFFQLGEVAAALTQYEIALASWRRLGNRGGEARTLHNRGVSYKFLGRLDEALDDFELALAIRQDLGDERGQASSHLAIGQILGRRGEVEPAFEAFRRSLELAGRRWRGRAVTLFEIGSLHQHLGESPRAREAYGQALELARRLKDRWTEAAALQGLGEVLDATGRHEEALARYRQALAIFEQTPSRAWQAMTLWSMSRSELRRGEWAQARAYIELALDRIEHMRSAPASHALRYSFFATKQSYYDFYVDLLMQLHRRDPSAGYDAEALTASERARARSQLDALAESKAELRRGADPQLRALEAELEQRIESLEMQRLWLLEEGAGEAELDAVERELRDRLRRYDRIESRIRRQSPDYAALTQPQPLGAREIQRRVVDGETLLLEFDLGAERSYLWVVSRQRIDSFELPPRAEIETAAARAYRLLSSSHLAISSVQTRLALGKLSDMLLGQATGLLDRRRLLVVSDGALQYIPFAALPRPGPPPAGHEASVFYDSPPLGVAHEVVNMPSASTLALLRDRLERRPPASGLIAILADPVFELDDPRVLGLAESPDAASGVRSVSKPGPRRFERLIYSQREADRILELAGAAESFAAVGFDANREAITSGKLGGYRLLHFATHGELNTEHPELSRLVLSRVDARGQPRDDGSLFAHEIYNLDLRADLVVLSACETALGAEIRGEGLLGLAQGFFYAGAGRVIVSLWKVDDQATAELMGRFYENLLARDLRPAAALREAQGSIRGERRWQAPYYWAGFLLLGEWT